MKKQTILAFQFGFVAHLLFVPAIPASSNVPVPVELRGAVEARRQIIVPDGEGFRGANVRQHFDLHFDRDAALVRVPGAEVRVRLAGYGRDSRTRRVGAASVEAKGNRVVYQRADLTEWYVNGQSGLEQGFTIAKRPEGSGRLLVALSVDGGFHPRLLTADSVILEKAGARALRYSDLKAWDASGRLLPATMEAASSQIRLHVQDAGAVYPVTIDPLLQQAKLVASDGLAGDALGYSVALSGNTALVGAFGKSEFTGAAYVYVKNGTTWSEQAILTASDGTTFNNFGTSVALDANTALVGAFENSSSRGAAYVFVRNGTVWTQQAKLVAADGQSSDEFGVSVSVSGNIGVVGALNASAYAGAAYVFVRSGSTWAQQSRLTASDGAAFDAFGAAVAVSGGVAVIGARANRNYTGAAYVFVQNGSTWLQQTKLTASDGLANDVFGSAVALSGNTALIGAHNTASQTGSAYVYVQTGSSWTRQAKLTALNGLPGDSFGSSVAVSGDVAFIGAPFQANAKGSAYFFVRSGSTWTQQWKVNASDGVASDQFGNSVGLSGNAGIAGAPFNVNSTGAAYTYNLPLVVASPNVGKAGTLVTLRGSGFIPNQTVYLLWNNPRVYLGSAVSSSTGTFTSVPVSVPAGAISGLNTIYAQGATAKDLAIGYFTIQ